MPYCPKCGVEVDNGVENCPLCSFPVPYIDESAPRFTSRYPNAKNDYPKNIQHIKNTAFITMTVIFFTTSFLLFFFEKTLYQDTKWSFIITASLFVVEMFFAAFWGYLKKFSKSLAYCLLSVLLLLYVIDFEFTLDD